MDTTFSVRKTSRSIPPRILYKEIKNDILGKNFDLSLVFVGDMLATRLNVERRQKSYAKCAYLSPFKNIWRDVYKPHGGKAPSKKI